MENDLEKEVVALRELLQMTSEEKNRISIELSNLKNKLETIRQNFTSLVFIDSSHENTK